VINFCNHSFIPPGVFYRQATRRNILLNSARSNLYSLTGKTSGLPIYELAGEILSASYFDASGRSRFVTRITAVEALLDPQPRSAAAQRVVAKLLEVVEEGGLDESTRAAMSGSLRWLNRESIGQAGRALAARLLHGRAYEGQAPDRFFSFCYNLRSSILHFGRVPVEITNFRNVCAAAHQFVCDILIASFAEVG
jgi:hypothetical protein